MTDNLTTGVVRILDSAGATVGTGFFVTDEGLIATCAHVVQGAGAGPGGTVHVVLHAAGEEREAQVKPDWWRGPNAEDAAILCLKGTLPGGAVPLPLGNSSGIEGHTLTTLGFPAAKPVEGMAGKCEVVGRTTERGFPVLQLRSSEVTPGFSGAPVYDTVTRRVVGMVTAVTAPDRYDRLAETAFIIPTETLRAICLELQLSDLCPYRGLAAFTEADAEFFFGREKLVTKLVDHVQGNPRFLAVIGPSGSGKSSVVQAGLFPALRRGEVPGSENWHIVTFCPGDDPFAALAAAGLDAQGDDLQAKVQDFLQAHPQIKRLVLFADQFEELFALCPESVQERFLRQLQASLESNLPVTVLLTLRADFYGHLLRNQPLVDWLEVGQVNVPPMGSEGLQAVIEKPALKLGLCFEPGLAEAIAGDAGEIDHPLPLLESALTQLWEKREDSTLTHAAYQVVGKVAGAIGQWAEDTYSVLDPGDQALAQRIFTRLVHYGEGETADTRRRCALSELVAQPEDKEKAHRLVQRLADVRLLVTGEETGIGTVEIIHDALLQKWSRLKQWIAKQREFYLWRQRLDERLREWEGLQDPGALLRGAPLAEAEGWLTRQGDDLNEAERGFIVESSALQEQERAARGQRQRRTMVGLAAGLVVISVLALLAWGQRNAALDAQTRAEEQSQIALSRQLAAQSINLLDTNNWETAMLLAIESGYVADTAEAFTVLRQVLAHPGRTRTILYHPAGVREAVWNSDESRILTTCYDGKVRVWDAQTGTILLTLSSHVGSISQAVWNTDETRILTVGCDQGANYECKSGSVRVWDTQTGAELVRLPSHMGDVSQAFWSKDESRILTASHDGTTRVWDAKTGNEMLTIFGHAGGVRRAAWNADETRILTSGCDQGSVLDCAKSSARVWDAQTGAELLVLSSQQSGVRRATWNADESRILTAGTSGTAQVWDAKTGEELLVLSTRGGNIAATWNKDESLILTWDWLTPVQIWDAQTGTELFWFKPTGSTFQAKWNKDGNRVLIAASEAAYIWDVQAGNEPVTLLAQQGSAVQALWNADESRVLTFGHGVANIWDAQTGERLLTLAGHQGEINQAMWTADEKSILTSSSDGTARVWDTMQETELNVFTGYNATWNTDGSRVLAANRSQDEDGRMRTVVRIWDTESGAEVAAVTNYVDWPLFPRLQWSSDENRVLGIGDDLVVRIWDTRTGELSALPGHEVYTGQAVWNGEGTRILTVGCDREEASGVLCSETTMRVWDAATRDELTTIPVEVEDCCPSIAWNSEETRILTIDYTSPVDYTTVRVWDVETGATLLTLPNRRVSIISRVAWTKDGKRLLISDNDNAVQVWDALTGELLATLVGHTDRVNSALWNAEESQILTAGRDGTARLWDARTGVQRLLLSGRADSIELAVWNNDGSRVLTAGDDGTVQVWDAQTGERLIEIFGHTKPVYRAGWNGDESRILTASHDDTLKVWYTQMDDLLEAVCKRAPRYMTQEEWELYLGKDEPYRFTCLELLKPGE